MKQRKVIIIVTLALLFLILLFCLLSYLDFLKIKGGKQLEAPANSNIDIEALLIQDEFIGRKWKLVETDNSRSNRAQLQTVEAFAAKMYEPVYIHTAWGKGMIYQEVLQARDTYTAWVLFDRPLKDSNQKWVEKEENFVEMGHHADQWYLSCADIHLDRRDCSLMARYSNIVVFLSSSFYADEFSQEKFLDLVKFIDETAGELGLYEP